MKNMPHNDILILAVRQDASCGPSLMARARTSQPELSGRASEHGHRSHSCYENSEIFTQYACIHNEISLAPVLRLQLY